MLTRRGRCGARCALASLAFAIAAFVPVFFGAKRAQASDFIIQHGRVPIGYTAEVEPHLVLGSAPPGPGYGSGGGIGVRASFVLAPEGFIRGLNDSVALGVGLDYSHYYGYLGFNGYRDQCLHFEQGPAGTSVCTEVTSNGGSYNYIYIPAVMQWNFWLTDRFSAFGEPGLNLYFVNNYGFSAGPALYIGGRLRLADRITLTARLGYPTIGIGVSFMQ
jgi:hypothetical protein